MPYYIDNFNFLCIILVVGGVSMTFGQRLKTLREENDITQNSLAQLLKVPIYLVKMWEDDKEFPEKVDLENISKLFDISIEELIEVAHNEILQDENSKTYIAKSTTYYDRELISDAIKSRYYIFTLSLLVAISTVIAMALISIIRCVVVVSMYGISGDSVTTILSVGVSSVYLVVALSVFFALRFDFKRKISINIKLLDMCFQEIYVLKNKIEIFESGKIKRHVELLYENIKTITETENYYIIEAFSKEIIIVDKSNAKGDLEYLSRVSLLRGKHKVKKIVINDEAPTYSKQELLREKYKSFLVSAITIASFCIATQMASIFMVSGTTIKSLTGFPYFYTATCMLYFLPVPVYCMVYGIKNKLKGLSYEWIITVSVAVIVLDILMNIGIASGISARM